MMKEVLGTFSVSGGNSRQQTIYVSQETITDETGLITNTIKLFNLDTADGEPVERTKDPNTYLMEDGTVLRKTSPIQLGDPEQYAPRIRRRRQRS